MTNLDKDRRQSLPGIGNADNLDREYAASLTAGLAVYLISIYRLDAEPGYSALRLPINC